ncbi:hypothetical protein PMI07_000819 [Rhizobium sp. CF080]|uniref:PD-(D/E)XK nuclease-like domain-containing protein n=1 Tax=Rhizobium sp. (strain CF080) TaxID=1144310 RepID=UPI000271D619|nr:PD-(D/E)XK nuclease-like domain-containing protein [Rhizobium sp. CF080]EUB97243.1 hypothetical protein PMI07_000819 [Rhizobium sp. CF080]
MKTYLDFKPDADGRYQLPDGIYFGLPEEIYHADTAIGSTSFMQLAKDPCKWQYDRLRPRKSDPKYLTWGRAWHCRVLEGKAAFEERYANPPVPSDYPDALNTTDQIKEFLRMHGQKLTGNKPELMARARELDECPPFFDEILARWYFDHPDHETLDDRQVQEIEDAVANMTRDPTLASVMVAGSLISGAAELSIIVTINGVRRKCRLDYAIPPAGDRVKSLIVDLKSFDTYKGGTHEQAGIFKVYDMCYDIQVAAYMELFQEAKKLLAYGAVYGDAPRDGFIKSLLEGDGVEWVWVMIRKDSGMIPVTLSIDTADRMFEHARNIVADTVEVYHSYMNQWGPAQLWTPPPKAPLRLNHSVMPSYNRGIQYEQPNNR